MLGSKGEYIGQDYGVVKGDTRSLDNGSYDAAREFPGRGFCLYKYRLGCTPYPSRIAVGAIQP